MTIKISAPIKGFRVATQEAAPEEAVAAVEDRRLELSQVRADLSDVLYLERRHAAPQGSPSWTFMVTSPSRHFGVVVGDTGGEDRQVFEVWVVGDVPRGMNAIAKNLSLDMRARDRKWLKAKLESLAKTPGDAFDMEMPDGKLTRLPSEVAAVARLVLWRCEALEMFKDDSDAPLIEAMMFQREPKTSADGTLSWTVDVNNPNTGDDFVLYVKEGLLPGSGQRRPFSIWLSGSYPRALDGLCKALSRDLWVAPVDWIQRKLDQLQDVSEPMGDFLAQVPGSEKRASYPSTVAYLAALVRHRLTMLGLLQGNGGGVVKPVLRLVGPVHEKVEPVAEQRAGELCSQCDTYSVIRSGGCATCSSCGASSCSG